MAQIIIKDQFGNPIGGIDIALRRREENIELFRQYPDLAGHTDFYYSALGVRVHNDLPPTQLWTLVFNRVEGLNAQWKDYEQNKLVNIDSFDVDHAVELQKTGTTPQPTVCPDLNDKNAISQYFFKVAGSVGAVINSPDSRTKMIPGITDKCGWEWQNQRRPPTRARIYFPPLDSNGASGRFMNTGDEGQPFNLSFSW